jgi:hypothetical protein
MPFHNMPYQAKAQAAPMDLRRYSFAATIEWLENVSNIFGGNAHASVVDANRQFRTARARLRLHLNPNPASLPAIFDRITNQVLQRARQFYWITHNQRQIIGYPEINLHIRIMNLRLAAIDRALHKVAHP